MINDHLDNAAGLCRLLMRFGVLPDFVRANGTGIQFVIHQPIPEQLQIHIEAESKNGVLIFGVWVKQKEDEHE